MKNKAGKAVAKCFSFRNQDRLDPRTKTNYIMQEKPNDVFHIVKMLVIFLVF